MNTFARFRLVAGMAFVMIGLLASAPAGYAQTGTDPCGQDFVFRVTKTQLLNDGVNWRALGRAMQTCDQLALLSDTAYTALIIERAYADTLRSRLDSLVTVLQQGQSLRDALIAEQDSFITFQRDKLGEYDALLVRSNQLVEDATRNTDRALRQMKLYRLLTVGGIVVGTAGLLIGIAGVL